MQIALLHIRILRQINAFVVVFVVVDTDILREITETLEG